MTLRVVHAEGQEPMDDETFVREILLLADLVAARLCVSYWRRRVRETEPRIRELEAQLRPSNPLRSKSAPDA